MTGQVKRSHSPVENAGKQIPISNPANSEADVSVLGSNPNSAYVISSSRQSSATTPVVAMPAKQVIHGFSMPSSNSSKDSTQIIDSTKENNGTAQESNIMYQAIIPVVEEVAAATQSQPSKSMVYESADSNSSSNNVSEKKIPVKIVGFEVKNLNADVSKPSDSIPAEVSSEVIISRETLPQAYLEFSNSQALKRSQEVSQKNNSPESEKNDLTTQPIEISSHNKNSKSQSPLALNPTVSSIYLSDAHLHINQRNGMKKPEGEFKRLQEEFEELKEKFEQVSRENSEVNQKYLGLYRDMVQANLIAGGNAKRKKSIAEFEEKVRNLMEAFNQIAEKLKVTTEYADKLKKDNNHLNNNNKKLVKQKNSDVDIIGALEAKLKKSEAQCDIILSEQAKLDVVYNNLRRQFEEFKEESASKLNQKERCIASLQQQIENTGNKVRELEEVVEQQNAIINQNNSNLTENQRSIAQLQEDSINQKNNHKNVLDNSNLRATNYKNALIGFGIGLAAGLGITALAALHVVCPPLAVITVPAMIALCAGGGGVIGYNAQKIDSGVKKIAAAISTVFAFSNVNTVSNNRGAQPSCGIQ